MCMTVVAVNTSIIFGVELFGEPALRTHNPAMFMGANLPYIVLPVLALVRMRKPEPFLRRF